MGNRHNSRRDGFRPAQGQSDDVVAHGGMEGLLHGAHAPTDTIFLDAPAGIAFRAIAVALATVFEPRICAGTCPGPATLVAPRTDLRGHARSCVAGRSPRPTPMVGHGGGY